MVELVEVKVPYSGSVEHVEINEWMVAEGSVVAEGDPIAEVSTDKVDTELESPQAGRLVKFLCEEGTEVNVGTAVALLAEADAPDDEVANAIQAYIANASSRPDGRAHE